MSADDAWTAYCRRVWDATQAQIDLASLWDAIDAAPVRRPQLRLVPRPVCPLCAQPITPGERATSKGAHADCQYGDDP